MSLKSYAYDLRLRFWYVRKYGYTLGRKLASIELMSKQQFQFLGGTKSDEHDLYEYLRSYSKKHNSFRLQQLRDAFGDLGTYKGVVLAPVAYDLSLKQRPDHLLSCLSNAGYLCIMMTIDDKYKKITRIEENLYVTNMFEDVSSYFLDENIFLYIHYPVFSCLIDFFDKPFVVYDVLDDFSIFSGDKKKLKDCHENLLSHSDVTLFSSKKLLDNNIDVTKNPLLLENGVWQKDFQNGFSDGVCGDNLRVGYHGILSELLDIELLKSIAQLPGVELVLVGPVAAFNSEKLKNIQKQYEELFKLSSVRYLGKLPYDDIKNYLQNIDIGLIPFVAGEGTDGVSPLKLFEFMAANKPILALPTKTVNEYAEIINVCDAQAILQIIKNRKWIAPGSHSYALCLRQHEWSNLTAPLLERMRTQVNKSYAAVKVPNKLVDIINFNFFDWDGEVLYKGGAERYVYDLSKIISDLGYQPRILQNANKGFERNFRGVPVVGVQTNAGFNSDVVSSELCKKAHNSQLVIASPLDLACSVDSNRPAIGINHGVYWDSIGNLYNKERMDYNLIFESLRRCRNTVCVDTNFINWVRTIDWDIAANLHYIPNYVDTKIFISEKKDFEDSKLKILLPRRLYEPRGLYLTIEAFDELFRTRNDLHLTLCGQAVGEDLIAVQGFVQRHKGKVDWIERDMDEMGEVYREHHIVLIPTLASEGTSLSCVEAFASNCAVIATNVGGLPNLVQDGINGILIRPIVSALREAIIALAEDRTLLERIAINASSNIDVYDVELWKKKWKSLILKTIW